MNWLPSRLTPCAIRKSPLTGSAWWAGFRLNSRSSSVSTRRTMAVCPRSLRRAFFLADLQDWAYTLRFGRGDPGCADGLSGIQ